MPTTALLSPMPASASVRSRQCVRWAVIAGLACALGNAHAERPHTATTDDLRWLNRITYGVNSATVSAYEAAGRQRYLDVQLRGKDDALPSAVQRDIDALGISQASLPQLLQAAEAEHRRIESLPDGDDKARAKQAQQQAQERAAYEASKRHLLRAIYSPAQLKEQMVWFWLNHFNVFRHKANLRWMVGDFEEQAIRPHTLGNFRDLLRATLMHPAMLVYLDNAQSAVGKVNENYARELLELHTMGVQGGYTQQDVQELARILTGVGVSHRPDAPRLKPEWQGLLIRQGAFEFNPARHDFGDKVLLGHPIAGRGFDEVEQAIDLIVRQPATARFISHKLAVAFVADEPPSALVDRMAQTFLQRHGDIPSVLRVMFNSPAFKQSLGSKFKDPMHYVVSALRLAYDTPTAEGRYIVNLKPVNGMLNGLGEGLYGKLTPDGYGLREADWASAGQMSKRFEIAKWIGSGHAGLFDLDDGRPAQVSGFPQLGNRLYYDLIEASLSPATREALSKASTQWEWNTYLLSSPDFMYH